MTKKINNAIVYFSVRQGQMRFLLIYLGSVLTDTMFHFQARETTLTSLFSYLHISPVRLAI